MFSRGADLGGEVDQRAMEGRHRFRGDARLDVCEGRSCLFREERQCIRVLGDYLSLAGRANRPWIEGLLSPISGIA